LTVVGDLGGVAELGRCGQAALADRAGVVVDQRHPPRLARRGLTGQSQPGLGDDLAEPIQEVFEIGQHPPEPPHRPIRHPLGVGQHASGLLNGGLGQIGEFAGDGQHLGLGLVAAAPQL
jgi:hypothetical protein